MCPQGRLVFPQAQDGLHETGKTCPGSQKAACVLCSAASFVLTLCPCFCREMERYSVCFKDGNPQVLSDVLSDG